MAGIKSALPGANVPLVDSNGLMNNQWWLYFQNEHNRTGGNSFDKVDQTSTAVIQAQTDIGDATAQGLFQVTQGTASSGAEATILLQVRTSLADPLHSASIKLSALAAGASRIEISASTIEIDGTLLNNGALLTENLGANAASLPGSVSGSGTITATTGAAWTFVTSFTDTFIGRPIDVMPGVEFDNSDTGDHTLQCAVTIDSTDPDTGTPPYKSGINIIVPKSPAGFLFALPVPDTPAAGSHTYRFYFKQQDGGTNVRARKWVMNYTERRR